jgi:hypothetical protein
MNKTRVTVLVNTFFEEKEALLNTLRKYSKSSDEKFAYWDEFAFTTDNTGECDAILVFNNPGEHIITITDPARVIAFMMEPGIKTEHPWMFKGLYQYAVVYSPVKQSSNSVPSHGFLGWHPGYDWQCLSQMLRPVKKHNLSCVSSNLNNIRGHRLRNRFISKLKKELPDIDYFGRGSNFITDKFTGLLPYKYSLALENSSMDDYFTEKINDCFLTYTVPLYYGCRNIGRYFPERSFIPVDILDPPRAIKKIRDILENDDFAGRLVAVNEARDLVLNKYQPLAGAAAILRKLPVSKKQPVIITPVPKSLVKKVRSFFGDIKKNVLTGR